MEGGGGGGGGTLAISKQPQLLQIDTSPSPLLFPLVFPLSSSFSTIPPLLQVIDPTTTRLGGISGGAIISTLTCGGYHPLDYKEKFATVFEKIRAQPSKYYQKVGGGGV